MFCSLSFCLYFSNSVTEGERFLFSFGLHVCLLCFVCVCRVELFFVAFGRFVLFVEGEGGGSPMLLLYSVGSFWFAVGLFHVGTVCSCLLHWQGGGEVGCPVLFRSLCVCGVSSSLLSTMFTYLPVCWNGNGRGCLVPFCSLSVCGVSSLCWNGKGGGCLVPFRSLSVCGVSSLLKWWVCPRGGGGPPVCWIGGVFLGGAKCTRCSSLLMCWGGGALLSCAVSVTGCSSLWCGLHSVGILCLSTWGGCGGFIVCCVVRLGWEWGWVGLSCAVLLFQCLWCMCSPVCVCWNGVFLPTLAEEVASLQGSTQGHEPQTPCPAEAQAGSGPLGNTFLPFVYTYSRVGPVVCPLERLRAHACGVDLHWPHREREKNQYQVIMLWAIEQPTELHKTKREKDIWSQIHFSVWGLGQFAHHRITAALGLLKLIARS